LLGCAQRRRRWNVATGEARRVGGDALVAAAFLPDGRLVTAGTDRSLRVWSPAPLPPRLEGDAAIAGFAGDGDEVVAVGRDDTMRRFDGDRVVATVALGGAARALAVAPDGAAAVVVGDQVRVWRRGGALAAIGDAGAGTGHVDVAWLGADVVSWNGASVR